MLHDETSCGCRVVAGTLFPGISRVTIYQVSTRLEHLVTLALILEKKFNPLRLPPVEKRRRFSHFRLDFPLSVFFG